MLSSATSACGEPYLEVDIVAVNACNLEITVPRGGTILDRVEALKVFCVLAETLQFRATAKQLSLSPQVVTRTIRGLEASLGEPLFQRSTRQVRLSAFGEQFLSQAQRLVEDYEGVFASAAATRIGEMVGVIRVTVPDFPVMDEVLRDVLAGIANHSRLTLDWSASLTRADVVDEQIDVGVRVGSPAESGLIMRRVGWTRDRIVAAPALIARIGRPTGIDDLQKNFPLCVLRNARTGRPWPWYFRHDFHFQPANPRFVADGVRSQLEATLVGAVFSSMQDAVCRSFLASGELVEVLADEERTTWPIHVYRPAQSIMPGRVRKVFDLLVDSLLQRLPQAADASE